MNTFFKKIVYSTFFVVTFLGFTQTPYADAACSVSDLNFSQVTGSGYIEENFTNLKITTNDCSDGIKVKLKAMNEAGNVEDYRIDALPAIFFPDENTGIVHMKLKTDEATCYTNNDENQQGPNWGHECVVFTEILDNNNQTIYNGNSPALVPNGTRYPTGYTNQEKQIFRQGYLDRGVILAQCFGSCATGSTTENDNDNWDFIQLYQNGGSIPETANCTLSNASSGSQADVYFDTISGPTITDRQLRLNIKTAGKCDSVPLKIQLWEDDGTASDNTIDIENSPNEDYLEVIAPTGDDLYIVYDANEDDCEGGSDPDCTIYVEIFKDGNRIFSSEDFLENVNSQNFLNNINFKKGVIASECLEEDDCRNYTSNDWRFLNTNGGFNGGNNPATISTVTPTYDTTSPCYELNANGTGKAGYDDDCYELLAPIPGLQSLNNAGESNIIVREDGRIAIDKLSEFKLGDYINSLFQIALGILMVLAVVMIVIAGVQYMTIESIYGKSDAKSKIIGAVTGLILSLGIFVILNTINPRLLEINFGENIEQATIEIAANQDAAGDIVGQGNIGTTFEARTFYSPGLSNVAASIASGSKISKIVVTGTEGGTTGNAKVILENGTESSVIPIGFGINGLSSTWVSGQRKSPTGTFTLGGQRNVKAEGNTAVFSNSGNANMGAGFISVDQSPYVGIGIHGKAYSDYTGGTYGCIRMKNSDILAIFDGIQPGITEIEISTL